MQNSSEWFFAMSIFIKLHFLSPNGHLIPSTVMNEMGFVGCNQIKLIQAELDFPAPKNFFK